MTDAISKVLRDSAYELLRELEAPIRDHNLIRVRTKQLKERIKEWDEINKT
jgi:hypothetical protein